MLGKKSKQFLLSAVVLGGCLVVALLLVFSRSPVKKEVPVASATLVDVIQLQRTNEPVEVSAYGTVQGNRTLTVHPEVSGKIVELAPKLVLGGRLRKGEMMLRIDPRDYELAIERAKASVEKAEFELKLEHGKQVVAEREWSLFSKEKEFSDLSRELSLRIPHLKEKEAALASAKSQLSQARLELERTRLTAPFNAIVTEDSAEIGQYVTPAQPLATLIATDEFRIQVSIPYERLDWIQLPRPDSDSGEVEVIQELGEGRSIERMGKILRLLGTLSPKGRMVRVLVGVEDPLGLEDKQHRKHPLLLGTYVRVVFRGPLLRGVYVIPRESIREGDRLWIMNDQGELEVRTVDIVFRREQTVVVKNSLKEGEKIVTSFLPVAIPGMKLRTVTEESSNG